MPYRSATMQHNTGVWRTDGQTHDDSNTAIAMGRAVIGFGLYNVR